MSAQAPRAEAHEWHCLTVDQAARTLDVDPSTGLGPEVASARLSTHGPNEIPEGRRRPLWRKFVAQLTDLMIVILIAAAVISGFVGELIDTIAIVAIVILNALVSVVQQYRAERAIAALRQMAAPTARVRRGGKISDIPASDVVPGDIVLLEAGNVIAADLRLLEAIDLSVDESALTGESQTVDKQSAVLATADLPLGDRINLAYKGTLATRGRGTGIAVATGEETELGRIAELLDVQETEKTPLQLRLASFGKRLAVAVLIICGLILIAGLLRGEPPVLMFLTAVSLAVAAVPEALPAVVTVALALGAARMVRHRALIRRLPAGETLGSVTYICADKTGTLTQNRMTVEAVYVDGRMQSSFGAGELTAPEALLATAIAQSNDAEADVHGKILGDPTEVALYVAARDAGFEKTTLEKEAPRIGEIAFHADRKCMTTLHRQGPDRVISFTKGAPEHVVAACTSVLTEDGPVPVDAQELLRRSESLAADGYRVLGVACREWPDQPAVLSADEVESELTFLGLVASMDPPRPEAAEAVARCKAAGIMPVMITGDHAATALTIARRLGIAGADDGVLTGQDLTRMSASELESEVPGCSVFARVNPEQKIEIVNALQSRGEFVAMTGDGVNDAPALKRADIGVAMGQRGTEVAREAADMVLLDDNFATIVSAVREGRRIYDNVRKFVKYTMTSNSGEIWTILIPPFLGLPIALLPIHILWINLVTDGLPGLALAVEPGERGLMSRPPRPPEENIFAHGLWQHVIWVGLLIGGMSILAQAWAVTSGIEGWQTITFTVLTLSQLAHVLAIRSETDSLFSAGPLSNKPLLGAVFLTILLQLAVIYVPQLNLIFDTEALTFAELWPCFVFPVVVFLAVEAEKLLVRRGLIYQAKTPPVRAAPAGAR